MQYGGSRVVCSERQFQFSEAFIAGFFGAGGGANGYVAGGFFWGEAETAPCSVTVSPAFEVFAYPTVPACVF